MEKQKLFLIDAYALIYKFYYAFIARPMRNNEGLNTSAVFGFTKFINDLVKREQPHYLGVAFDSKGKTFRHELDPNYKANRQQTPEDITLSVPYIKRILGAMNIPVLELCGYEADDIIGTLSREASEAGFEVYMVTPDKDYGQLIRPTVFMYKPGKNGDGVEVVGCDKINDYYGISDPRQVADILALWGDASDNIPGVPGVGEKSATKLVGEFGTVENLLANTDKLKGKLKESVEASRDRIVLSKKLATIDVNVPIDFVPERLALDPADTEKLSEIYKELNFNMFLKGVARSEDKPKLASLFNPPQKPSGAASLQGSLFDDGSSAAFSEESNYETAATVAHTYEKITTAEEAERLAGELKKHDLFCFDTETAGFDVFNDRIVGVSFAVKPHEAYYVVCPESRSATMQLLDAFKPLFEDEKIAKVGQNIKFDAMVLAQYGIKVRGFFYDTMVIHYLLDADSRHNMDYLARRYLGYSPVPIEDLIGKGARQITMDRVPVDRVVEYAAEDADVTLQLKEALWPQLQKEGLEELYRTVEEPLIGVLADMELEGVKIDTEVLAAQGRNLTTELIALEAQIREAAGDPLLNVNSARQLGEVLFEKLRIDPSPKKTKTRQYRTDEEYLQSLAHNHPVVEMILEYRGYKKLLSTYIEALPLLVNRKTGRIHTSFNQAVTSTGRLSSNNPNLQNIPIRDRHGREIRKAFVPSGAGCCLVSADYSQIELRIMAHLSEDPSLVQAFLGGEDIHSATAAKIFGVDVKEVTSDQRRKAKTANFGIIYGISAFGLAQRLDIPRGEASALIQGYFASYPGVRHYIDRSIAQAREKGYVATLFGRRKNLPDINSSNAVVRGLADRNAINAPIQGSAADVMKLAMIAAHKTLESSGLKSRIILQVHDELVVNTYKSELEEVKKILTASMEGVARLRVPLTVECNSGENWLEAH